MSGRPSVVAKPDLQIFAAAGERYGADTALIVFFDDRANNVDGAAAAGRQAHLWTGHAAARDVLPAAALS